MIRIKFTDSTILPKKVWEQAFNSPSEAISFISHHDYLRHEVIEGEELMEMRD